MFLLSRPARSAAVSRTDIYNPSPLSSGRMIRERLPLPMAFDDAGAEQAFLRAYGAKCAIWDVVISGGLLVLLQQAESRHPLGPDFWPGHAISAIHTYLLLYSVCRIVFREVAAAAGDQASAAPLKAGPLRLPAALPARLLPPLKWLAAAAGATRLGALAQLLFSDTSRHLVLVAGMLAGPLLLLAAQLLLAPSGACSSNLVQQVRWHAANGLLLAAACAVLSAQLPVPSLCVPVGCCAHLFPARPRC